MEENTARIVIALMPMKELSAMTLDRDAHEQPQQNQEKTAPTGNQETGGPTVNQRLGLAIISLVFLVFMANIMATLSSSFGATGSAIGLAAVCLTVLGINIVFNLDALRARH
jgi:hypothetical protein